MLKKKVNQKAQRKVINRTKKSIEKLKNLNSYLKKWLISPSIQRIYGNNVKLQS